jgi:Rrf2 family protein
VALEGQSGAPVSIAQIAAGEGISGVYAAKLMRQLRIAGLVESTRGAAGGYRLTRDADEITVWDAIGALDDSFLPAATCDCDPEDRIDCRRTTDCAVSSLWRRIGDEVRSQLSGISLAELCRGTLDTSDRVELPVMATAGPRTSDNTQNEGTVTWRYSN